MEVGNSHSKATHSLTEQFTHCVSLALPTSSQRCQTLLLALQCVSNGALSERLGLRQRPATTRTGGGGGSNHVPQIKAPSDRGGVVPSRFELAFTYTAVK